MRQVLSLVVVLFFARFGAGQEETPDALVRRLGSVYFSEREDASRKLDKLGEKALPALVDAARSSDLETQRRAAQLFRRIRDRLLLDLVRKPARIRLNFKDVPLGQALEETTSLTGLRFQLDYEVLDWTKRRITLDTGNVSLWDAVDQLLSAAGLAPKADLPPSLNAGGTIFVDHAYTADGTLLLDKRSKDALTADHSSSVRVGILPSKTSRGFHLDLALEPRLGWLQLENVEFTGVWRDKLKAVVPKNLSQAAQLSRTLMTMLGGTTPYPRFVVPVSVAAPVKEKTIPLLEGRIALSGKVKQQCLAVDIANAAGQRYREPGGVLVQVLEVKLQDDGGALARILLENFDELVGQHPGPKVIRLKPGSVAVRGPADLFADGVELADAAGRAWQRGNVTHQPSGMDGVELRIQFEAPETAAAPLRLTISTYRHIAFDVPFTLRNVPIPE
ncbi:MAG: hypothetical protein L0Y72_05575 [Gemmataceae bacterium]|nr:hypothetical protein [Gemmataceae bacterium]MCI0738494.1 hypothetical protein [Gemmataceae bacterium]